MSGTAPSATRVALLTYSTKPRGGVVHTLAVAEALAVLGTGVEVITLAGRGAAFFREVAVPWQGIESPAPAATLEERVFNSVDAMADGLRRIGSSLPPILHAQDCISARAACRVRDEGAPITVVRTVHHVDDFSTPALVECQRRAIYEPDRVLVVSETWRGILEAEYAVHADVVPNGVDVPRFAKMPDPALVEQLRTEVGKGDRFMFLTVGGIEPRKGSDNLVRALAAVSSPTRPMLVVVGGQSFQDHTAYRQGVLESLPGLGLELGVDVVCVGTVDDEVLPAWYHAADALAFPSVNEGWGLAVLEGMAAGLPVVATDIPVFREYLTDELDALLVPVGDVGALARAMSRMAADGPLRDRLSRAGRHVAGRYGWDASARRHLAIYQDLGLSGGKLSDP
ncbi:MAG: MSMEG_0565 family glycosyltransferase [Acidimicrobiales bacterium]